MILYMSGSGSDPYALCYVEEFASGITGYSLVSGTTNCFSGGTNYALISSGASGDTNSTIAKSISSRTINSIAIKFNIEANASDDAGLIGTMDIGNFTMSFNPSREVAFDASERAYLNINSASYTVSTAKLSIGTNYQFDLTLNVGSAATSTITNLDTSSVVYSTTLPTLAKPLASSVGLYVDNAPNVKRTKYTYFRIC